MTTSAAALGKIQAAVSVKRNSAMDLQVEFEAEVPATFMTATNLKAARTTRSHGAYLRMAGLSLHMQLRRVGSKRGKPRAIISQSGPACLTVKTP